MYQKSNKRLTARVPFVRVLRKHLNTLDSDMRIQKSSVEAMREATEEYLTEVLADSNLCAIHGFRMTVMLKDLLLASRIRGDANRGY